MMAGTLSLAALAPTVLAEQSNAGTIAQQNALKTRHNLQKFGSKSDKEGTYSAYRPDGLHFGSIIAKPSVATTTHYDDNVFAQPNNRKGDIRIDISPSLDMTARLPRHALSFGFAGRLSRYLNTPDLDHNSGSAYVKGALHINHGHTLSFAASTRYDHEDNISPFAPLSAREFTPVWHSRAALGLTRDIGRLHTTIGFSAQQFNYYDVIATDGTTIDQDQRDHSVYTTSLKAGYRYSPGLSIVARARHIRYDAANAAAEAAGLSGDAYEALLGLSLQWNPLWRVRLLGGYGLHDVNGLSAKNITNTLFETSLEWWPTRALTVKAQAKRSYSVSAVSPGNEFNVDGASITTIFRMGVDYQMMRNLVLNAGAAYRFNELHTGQDSYDYYTAHIGVNYFHSKFWKLSLKYQHTYKDDHIIGWTVPRNRVWASATLRF